MIRITTKIGYAEMQDLELRFGNMYDDDVRQQSTYLTLLVAHFSCRYRLIVHFRLKKIVLHLYRISPTSHNMQL